MDFLHKASAFIVPYASTLFIMVDGQAHTIPMKRDAEKKRVLPALQFSINREPSQLASLKRDKGLCASRQRHHSGRKHRGRKEPMGRQDASMQGDKVKNASSHSIQVQRTSPGNKANQEFSIQRRKGNEDVARLDGGECHGSSFRRVLEYSGELQNLLEPSGIR